MTLRDQSRPVSAAPALDFETRINHGNYLIEQNHPAKAAPFIEALFVDAAADLRVHLLMGMLRLQQKRAREAIPFLKTVYDVLPDVSVATNLVAALRNQRRLKEALNILEPALTIAPDNETLIRHAIYCYHATGKKRKAYAYAAQLMQKLPNDAEVNILFGIAQSGGFPYDQCNAFVQRGLALAPNDSGLLGLASAFYEIHLKIDHLIAVSERLLALDPDDLGTRRQLLQYRLCSCDWQDYDGLVDTVRNELKTAMAAGQELPYCIFNLQAMPFSYAEIVAAARYESARIAAAASPEAKRLPARPRTTQHNLRLGYMLPYTHFHSLPLVMIEVVKRHNLEAFETFGYCIQPCEGAPFSRRYRRAFQHFADVPRFDPQIAANRIREDQLDILIDLSGHTPVPTMDIMAERPAPIQVHAFGYSITTGADYIDYILTDKTYINAKDRALGSEIPVYLPDCFLPGIKGPRMTRQISRAAAGLPEDGLVFVNFNDTYKFAPDAFAAWMTILQEVPNSLFWMVCWWPDAVDNVKAHAEKYFGIDPARIVAVKTAKHALHLRRLTHADIALDNFRHGGGITTLDYFRAGVPLVTLEGDSPAARLGATMSRAVGIDSLIARTPKDYIDTAVALAEDPARRHLLREALLSADETTPLFNIDRFVHHMERGLQAIYDHAIGVEAGNSEYLEVAPDAA